MTKYKKANVDPIAPEGGWGYMVLMAMIFGFVASFGFMSLVGLMFGDFLKELGLQTKALTLLPSCFYIAFSPVGLFTNYLFNRFSVRSVGIFGAIIFCSGSMGLIFVTSLNQLIFAYSILQGLGFGLILPALFTTFNRYFIRRRVTAMGLVGTSNALMSVILPVLIEYLKHKYGFRGCMAILAALNLHVLFGMIALHPVEWHQPPNKISSETPEAVCIDHNSVKSTFLEQENDTLHSQEKSYEFSEYPGKPKSFWKKIIDFLDLTLLHDPIYANICIGMALVLFSDLTFATIQPSYIYELDFNKMDTAMIVSFGAGVNMISLILVTIVGSCVQIQARLMFLSGVITTIVLQCGFLTVDSFMGLAAFTGAIGFFRACIHIPIAIVFAEYLPPKRFPSGYGLFMVIQGITMMLMGPLIGWIRDYTQSFPLTFNCITLAMIACAVPWSIEMLIVRRKQRIDKQQTG